MIVDCAAEQIVPTVVVNNNNCMFSYRDHGAKSVSLAGSFNDWDRTSMSMKKTVNKDGQHVWSIGIRLPEGIYSYKFVIDNNVWVVPPHADAYASDGFGGKNGILIVSKGLKQVKE